MATYCYGNTCELTNTPAACFRHRFHQCFRGFRAFPSNSGSGHAPAGTDIEHGGKGRKRTLETSTLLPSCGYKFDISDLEWK